MRGLSKSRYTTFCQCEKALWLKTYKPQEEVLVGSVTLPLPYFARKAQIMLKSAFGRTPRSSLAMVFSPLKQPQASPALFGA